jgi:hypothetical protein
LNSRARLNWRPKVCIVCGVTYSPTSPPQKVCVDCRDDYRRRYDAAKKRGIHQSFKSKILENRQFIGMIEDKIVNRRGSILVTKTLVRTVLRKLDIEKEGLSYEWEYLYRKIEDMMRVHGGIEFGETIKGGLMFKFPKKER